MTDSQMNEAKMAVTDEMVEAGAKALHERHYLGGPYPDAVPEIAAARERRWAEHPEEDQDYWHDIDIRHDGKKTYREMARTVLQAALSTTPAVMEGRDMRIALEQIRDAHLGDCPAAADEFSHARAHIYKLRLIAHEALSPTKDKLSGEGEEWPAFVGRAR